MGFESELAVLINIINEANKKPLAIHVDGIVTYIIYGTFTIATSTGYAVLRITDVSANQTYLDSGFLLESSRFYGANGSAANVNLKTDHVNTLLLVTDPTITYA